VADDLVWETTFSHGPGRRMAMEGDLTNKRKRSKAVSLPIVEANAGGIDIDATQIFVAVPADRGVESIRCFDTFTADLERLADWLEQCQIRTVAMESTGVYWTPLFRSSKSGRSMPAWSMRSI